MEEEAMPVDRYGDPLPANAVARLGNLRFPQAAPFTALAFTPDGRSLLSAGQDSALRVWEVMTGKERHHFGIDEGAVLAGACSPDGHVVVTGGFDGGIRFWEASTGSALRQVQGHPGGVLALAFTGDGDTLLSAGADRVVRVWDARTGAGLGQFDEDFGDFEVLAVAPDNTTLALGNWESTIRLCDLADGRESRRLRGPHVGVKALAFSPDGRTLATGSVDGGIGIWELATGKERRQYPKHPDGTFAVAFSPDGRLLATAGAGTTVLIWDVTGRWQEKAPGQALVPAQLPPLWDALADDDAVQAYRAVRALAAAPALAASFLHERLRRVAPFDPPQVARWIVELADGQFAVRERATQDLEELAALIEPALRAALAAGPAPEARRRLERLLAKLSEPVPVAVLQALRGVEALEVMATAEARRALDALGRRLPESLLVQDARTAAQRLASQVPQP
jgi:hypothetical protein